jgi:F0F1-type ATP synthase beta subunit
LLFDRKLPDKVYDCTKTAFEELNKKHGLLATGIEKIDSLLQLVPGDRVAVVGSRKYSQILVTRPRHPC